MASADEFLGIAEPQQSGQSAPLSADAFLDQTPQMTGLSRELALPASAMAKGIANFLGMPGTIQQILAPGLKNVPSLLPKGMEPARLPTSTDVVNAAKEAGIVDRPDLQPQNGLERAESAAFQGMGSALPLLATGGSAAPLLLGGAGAGVGSMYGEDIGGRMGHPIAGSLVGGLLGGGIGSSVGSLGTRIANSATDNLTPLGQAYKTAEVPTELTGDVSGKPRLQSLQAFNMRAPGAQERMTGAADRVVNAFGNSAENTAANLGASRTLEEAGQAVQGETAQWLNRFKTNSQAAWNAVNTTIGPTSPVDLAPVKTVLDNIRASAGGNAAAESFLKSPLAKQIEGVVDEAGGGTVPWATAHAIKSRIGEYLENPQLIADAGGAQAKRLYGAFSNGMEATAAASPNPNALNLYQLANAYTAKGHDFIENVISPFVSGKSDAASVANGLLNSGSRGGETLARLRTEMPGAADELAAYKLRDMALSNAGAQNATGTAVSPSTFVTDWNKLSPEAKATLYADPATRQKVDALATVGESIKDTAKAVNTSGTTHTGIIYNFIKSIPALAGTVGGGLLGAKVGMGGGEGGVLGLLAGERAAETLAPLALRGGSYLSANRPLASVLAAQAAKTIPGQGLLLGVNPTLPLLLGPQPAGLLNQPR